MSEADNFALVPSPPGALEKAQPGAKRILTGMVSDTLAMVKKDSSLRTRSFRIVIMDDEPFVGDAMKMMIEFWWSDATVLTFTDAEEAMQELLREDPDLFTTDWNHTKIPCEDMLGLLADRKAKYPILVISGSAERLLEIRISDEFRNQGLDVKLLAKPITADQLHGELLKHFGLGNPSTQFREK